MIAAITAVFAKEIFVRSVQLIVAAAMKPFVPDVQRGAKFVMNRCVQDVHECDVQSVNVFVVNHVL